MTPTELREACAGSEYVMLHVGHQSTGYTIRLTPGGGPRGEIICCPTAGGTTGRWLSRSVLRWLEKHCEEVSDEPAGDE